MKYYTMSKFQKMDIRLLSCLLLSIMLISSLFASDNDIFVNYELQKAAQQDLDIMYHTIFEDHPGPYNQQDHEFVMRMNQAYQQACHDIDSIHCKKDHFLLLKKFAQSFHDEHLTIGISGDIDFLESFGFKETDCVQQLPNEMRYFNIIDFTDEIVWITIPNFAPTLVEQEQLELLIKQLSELRTKKYIIFDVRGNGGGSTLWATRILESLFTAEYVAQKFVQEYRDCYEDWRASKTNIEYWKDWLAQAEKYFGRDSVEFKEHQNLIINMQKAYDDQQPLYAMKEFQPQQVVPQFEAQNQVHAEIIVIIDRKCFSSCLGFIHELKSIDDSVLLLGERTATNTAYMEIRDEILPSGIHYRFPTAIGRNSKPFFHFYIPDIAYPDYVNDQQAAQEWVEEFVRNLN